MPFRNFRGPLFHKAVTSSSHILWKRVHFCFQTFANKKKSLDGATCLRFITFHSMVLIAECFYEYFFSLSSTWVILFLIAQLARSDPRNSFSACWPFAFSCSFAQIFIMKIIRKISLWPKYRNFSTLVKYVMQGAKWNIFSKIRKPVDLKVVTFAVESIW